MSKVLNAYNYSKLVSFHKLDCNREVSVIISSTFAIYINSSVDHVVLPKQKINNESETELVLSIWVKFPVLINNREHQSNKWRKEGIYCQIIHQTTNRI